jgi:Glucodextranase, domain B/FecR protein
VAQKRQSGFQISYVTITYRSVLLGILLLFALIALVMYFAFPTASDRVVSAGEVSLGKLLNKIGLGGTASGATVDPGPQQAHFTNIDGTVRVKKASSNTWLQADYSLELERNDVVQTSPEGIAKVVFADGTNYTVKPDSLIVIQENFLNSAQQTEVAVQVTTGTVDLATATITPGSKSQVTVAGATATMASESAAEVQNDARNDQHSIAMKKGSGEVNRAGQDVKIGDNEKLSFTSDAKEMTKTTEVSPPFLIGPFDNQQVSLSPTDKGVVFYWSEVPGNRAYHLKVSRNPFFTTGSLAFDKNVTGSQMVLPLPEGTYYWVVQTIGEDGKESMESPKSKFFLVPKGNSNASIALELGDFVQIGHVIEVKGRTEAGARVMVNGQEAVVNADGTFRHFTNSLPTGDNMITVTAQNTKGGVNTKQRTVPIQ